MELLADRYELRKQIGAGGMATVWEAWDTRLDRPVAVKLLARALSADPEFVARFEREARHAAHLNHPNIVTIFDFGTEDDTSYLVMELVVGESLGELLRREGQLNPERTIQICQAVLGALAEAHSQHIIHRDIKPSNILISNTGTVKLADFGIAHSLGDSTVLTDTGVLIGTVGYLSPEQCAGEPATERSDLYAVGCMAYQCLAGRPPFTGETPISIMYQHQHADAVSVGERRPGLPTGITSAIDRALQKDPRNRFASANEMAEVIAHDRTAPLTQSSLLLTTSTERVQQTAPLVLDNARGTRRRRTPYVLGALALVVIIAAVVAIVLEVNQPKDKTAANHFRNPSHKSTARTPQVASSHKPVVVPTSPTTTTPATVPPTTAPPPTTVPSGDGAWSDPVLTITPTSLGAVQVGMAVVQAQQASGYVFNATGDGFSYPDNLPSGLHLYVGSNCVGAAMNTTSSAPPTQTIRTPEGFQLGQPVGTLQALYGSQLQYVAASTGISPGSGYLLTESTGNLFFDVDPQSATVTRISGGSGALITGPNSCSG